MCVSRRPLPRTVSEAVVEEAVWVLGAGDAAVETSSAAAAAAVTTLVAVGPVEGRRGAAGRLTARLMVAAVGATWAASLVVLTVVAEGELSPAGLTWLVVAAAAGE